MHCRVVILEDDAEFVSREDLTVFPSIPDACDMLLLRSQTMFLSEPICSATTARWAHWGIGLVGYGMCMTRWGHTLTCR